MSSTRSRTPARPASTHGPTPCSYCSSSAARDIAPKWATVKGRSLRINVIELASAPGMPWAASRVTSVEHVGKGTVHQDHPAQLTKPLLHAAQCALATPGLAPPSGASECHRRGWGRPGLLTPAPPGADPRGKWMAEEPGTNPDERSGDPSWPSRTRAVRARRRVALAARGHVRGLPGALGSPRPHRAPVGRPPARRTTRGTACCWCSRSSPRTPSATVAVTCAPWSWPDRAAGCSTSATRRPSGRRSPRSTAIRRSAAWVCTWWPSCHWTTAGRPGPAASTCGRGCPRAGPRRPAVRGASGLPEPRSPELHRD